MNTNKASISQVVLKTASVIFEKNVENFQLFCLFQTFNTIVSFFNAICIIDQSDMGSCYGV